MAHGQGSRIQNWHTDKAVGYKTGTRTRQQDTKLAHGQGSRIQNWHTDKAAGYKRIYGSSSNSC